jgi:hypothetical protein
VELLDDDLVMNQMLMFYLHFYLIENGKRGTGWGVL